MNKNTAFSQRFTELRKLKGLTQDTAAKVFNVSRSAIGMWEQGKRIPSIDDLESIADYFNVDISFLLGRENTTTRLLSSDELYLIQKYREVSKDNKLFLKQYLDNISRFATWGSSVESTKNKLIFENYKSQIQQEQDSLVKTIHGANNILMILFTPEMLNFPIDNDEEDDTNPNE